MMFTQRRVSRWCALFFCCFVCVHAGSAGGQADGASTAELIKSLSNRPWGESLDACGSIRTYFAIASSIVRWGAASIRELEKAFDSLEAQGEASRYSENSYFLLLAYARIKGASAYPRLRTMAANPKLAFLALGLDSAAALSLNLTSYVSESSPPVLVFHCRRADEPRDVLDQLILGWERHDREWFEGSLGPTARAALNSMLKEKTWNEMRTELWLGKSGGPVAVGYRFEISGRWSEPEEMLDKAKSSVTFPNLETPEIPVQFKNISGGDCGKISVKFLKRPKSVDSGYRKYFVDNSNLQELLGVIASCATKP
jgi:hypothetical protein